MLADMEQNKKLVGLGGVGVEEGVFFFSLNVNLGLYKYNDK